MRNPNIESWTVKQTADALVGAKEALQERNISVSNRMHLSNAAAAASVHMDDLAAVLEYRMRRAAQRATATETAAVEEELEFA